MTVWADSPAVSIILPFWNAEKFLAEAVESIFIQDFNEWELILIDDGSSDGSAAIADRFVRRDPARVCMIRLPENSGASAARNAGIRASRAPIIAFNDADDLWLPGKLKKQIEELRAHPRSVMVVCPMLFHYENEPERNFVQPIRHIAGIEHEPPVMAIEFLRKEISTPGPPAVLIKKEILEEVGGFEERFKKVFTDQSLWLKIAAKYPIYVNAEPLVTYRISESGSVARAMRDKSLTKKNLGFALWAYKYTRSEYPASAALREAAEFRLARAIKNRVKDAPFLLWPFREISTSVQVLFAAGPGTAIRQTLRMIKAVHFAREGN